MAKYLSVLSSALTFCVITLTSTLSQAQDDDKIILGKHDIDYTMYGRVTNLPIPRYVSLKGEKTNMRSGPQSDDPIIWIYHKKGLPVEIIDEYEHWRKVRDLDESEGWIHQSVLSGRRTIVTLEGTHKVRSKPDHRSDPVAIVEGGTVAELQTCRKDYCYLVHEQFSGWLSKSVIWGIADNDVF